MCQSLFFFTPLTQEKYLYALIRLVQSVKDDNRDAVGVLIITQLRVYYGTHDVHESNSFMSLLLRPP
jgi:hypothetical protein